ncbi:MAG: DUF6101 family protein [Beijerinckiaceae bacterium]
MSGTQALDGARHEASCCGGGSERQRVEIGAEWVCIRRTIVGLETWVNVPTQSYRGVALRRSASGHFEVAFLHVDPALDVILCRAPDDADVIALWRRHGRAARLPLLVEDSDGRLQPLPEAPPAGPAARRYGSALKLRRPRFLARRPAGLAASGIVHRGEIDLFAGA